jgi:ligand-binding SRPBCC domain-containing protein
MTNDLPVRELRAERSMDMNVSPSPEPLSFTERQDGTTHLLASQWIPRPIEEVFRFFSQPENLSTLTPAEMHFTMLTPSPVEMKEGQELSYRLKVKGIPIGWTSKITLWDPPHAFADLQLKGPYRTWDHTHRFERDGAGTRVLDEVIYHAPGFRWMERLIVRPDIRNIFSFRHQTLERLLSDTSSNLG